MLKNKFYKNYTFITNLLITVQTNDRNSPKYFVMFEINSKKFC